MRAAVLIFALVVACLAVASADPFIGGLGLLAKPFILPFKGAALLAALLKGAFKFPFGIGKRSVREDVAGQEMVLASVAQLDPNGCLLKLLCHLQTKDAAELTHHESTLAGMFRETSEPLTPYSTAFVYAVGVGSKSRNSATCEKIFAKCPLEYVQLSSVLEEAWSCPIQE